MSKPIDYDVIKDLLDPKKKTVVVHGFDPTQPALKKLIKLAQVFNKTVSFKVWKYDVQIDKNTRLKDVFAKCKKIEAARLAYKPSAKDIKGLDMSQFDEGPFAN